MLYNADKKAIWPTLNLHVIYHEINIRINIKYINIYINIFSRGKNPQENFVYNLITLLHGDFADLHWWCAHHLFSTGFHCTCSSTNVGDTIYF